ncbi:MAG TPA: molecular chaperone DnaJ [Acidimicrobiales bacterium]|nr:molecular chaperone DnaJ [Acidimicrobiales bacterium]
MAPQREWFEKDYYKVLGVSENATQKEISRAYRKLARDTHPDRNAGQEERFKEVSAAYEVIGDEGKRKEYDEVRRLGPVGAGFGGRGGSGGPFGGAGGSFRVEDLGDLGDLFGGLFGGGQGSRTRRGPSRGPGPQRGGDVEAELHLAFVDAVNGVTTTVNLAGEASCATCGGSGARPGTSPVACPKCGGRGVLDDNQGLFSLSTPCDRCAGRGVVVEDPCPTCHGSGVQRRQREVKVRIPSGVEDGQRIRVKGRGRPGRNGGPPGDLFVVVRVAPHPLYGRRGRDLTLTVPVTYPEAALGADITVPTLNGGPVTLRLPEGTRSGRTLRIKGNGVPSSGTSRPGDLLVTVEVAVPTKLSDAERKAVEELAAASSESPRAHLEVG